MYTINVLCSIVCVHAFMRAYVHVRVCENKKIFFSSSREFCKLDLTIHSQISQINWTSHTHSNPLYGS